MVMGENVERKELAIQLKHNRHNCCQAVLGAFADEVSLSEDALRQLGAAFGGGMGRMEGTCGALVAAEMLLGLKRFEGRSRCGCAAQALRGALWRNHLQGPEGPRHARRALRVRRLHPSCR